MQWWGKIIGGAFGFMLGGPLGALFGAALGHNFDQGLKGTYEIGGQGNRQQERVQAAFFTATFSVMGHICKADGRVTQDEIALAKQVMSQMDLSAQQRKVAITLFNEGKKPGFQLEAVLMQLKQETGYRPNLTQMFIEIQLYAAYADGILHADERKLLLRVCVLLGISEQDFNRIATAIGGETHHKQGASLTLADAYAILNISAKASDAEVKKAYRRLMNQHHPDKLVSKGLPEEMMKLAEQRTHEVRQAYERIKQERGF